MILKVTYSPNGADPKVWEFNPRKLLTPEVVTIEKLSRLTFGQWMDALFDQSMQAVHPLIYVLLKRSNPTLRPDQVAFGFDDVELDAVLPDDEARRILGDLRAKPELTGPEAELVAELEERFRDDDAAVEGDEAPKDSTVEAPSTSAPDGPKTS